MNSKSLRSGRFAMFDVVLFTSCKIVHRKVITLTMINLVRKIEIEFNNIEIVRDIELISIIIN